jgi:thiamine biosynthesis protein ThiI
VTRGRPGTLARAVATFDEAAIADAVAHRTRHEPRLDHTVRPDAPGAITADAIPEDATVLDLRSARDYRAWHWPGALHLEYFHALQAYRTVDRRQRYVLYCEVGLKSAHLAERLQGLGIDARHVPAGVASLRRAAESAAAPERA